MADNAGDLYIVATPIGNLADMVPRGLAILKAVDVILAEDTRHSGRLLAHFGIATPMQSYHDHSDDRQVDAILQQLASGRRIALISDAGTPLIADPGYRLVQAARQQGTRVTPVPGPCALVTALCGSGLPTDRFAFEGFLPAKSAQRHKRLNGLATESRTLVFYEAPHRVLETLAAMAEVFGGERRAVLARELTKTHETWLSGVLSDLVGLVAADSNQQRGEIVLVIEGASAEALTADVSEQERILAILLAEMPVKQAVAVAARITLGSKNSLYQLALRLRDGGAGD